LINVLGARFELYKKIRVITFEPAVKIVHQGHITHACVSINIMFHVK